MVSSVTCVLVMETKRLDSRRKDEINTQINVLEEMCLHC